MIQNDHETGPAAADATSAVAVFDRETRYLAAKAESSAGAAARRGVGARIASLRFRLDRSESDFARLLDVTLARLREWECGRGFEARDLQRIADATGTALAWLTNDPVPTDRRADDEVGLGPAGAAFARPRRVMTDARPPDPIGPSWDLQMQFGAGPTAASEPGRPSALCLTLPGATVVCGERGSRYRLIKHDLADRPPEVLLSLVLSGRRRFEQNGRICEGGEGAAVFASSSEEGAFSYAPAGRYLGLFAPAEALRLRAPGYEDRLMRPLDPESRALRLLAAYVSALMKAKDGLPDNVAASVADHLIDLCALLLGASGDERAIAETRGVRAAQRAAVQEAIDAGAAAPGFTAQVVAERLGVSTRYVHFLLEEGGEGFGRRVLERRLEVMRERLADRRFDSATIAELAGGCGFDDLAQFHRQFGARFGEQASAFRARR